MLHNKHLPLLFALLLCIAVWLNRGYGAFGVETDFYGCYAPQAKALLEHGTIPLDHFRGPLYPTLLALTVAATPFDFFQSAFLINLLCLAGLFFLTANLVPNSTLPLWFVFTAPPLLFALVQAGTDPLFLLLTTACTIYLLKGQSNLAGIAVSLALLTRTNGIALMAPLLLFGRPRAILWPACAILGWGTYTFFQTGDFFHNLNFLNTAALGSANLDLFWYSTANQPAGWSEVLHNPQTWAHLYDHFPKVLEGVFTIAFFPLVPICLYRLYKQQQTIVLICLACLTLPLFLVHWDTRTALPLLPLLAMGLREPC